MGLDEVFNFRAELEKIFKFNGLRDIKFKDFEYFHKCMINAMCRFSRFIIFCSVNSGLVCLRQ